jgi:hypothetical protein
LSSKARTISRLRVEEKRQSVKLQKEMMLTIRPTCFSCPIWSDCLKWGFTNEEFGVWGGFTSTERRSFQGKAASDIRRRAFLVAKQFGVTEEQIEELM